jgi:hypothetical protein
MDSAMSLDGVPGGSPDESEPDARAEQVELTEPEWQGPGEDDDEFNDVGTDQDL